MSKPKLTKMTSKSSRKRHTSQPEKQNNETQTQRQKSYTFSKTKPPWQGKENKSVNSLRFSGLLEKRAILLTLVVTLVTMVIRVYYVTLETSWWILHPDEIYQSLEVAYSELHGYGFRTFEFQVPGRGNNLYEQWETERGMHALRSPLFPRFYLAVSHLVDLVGCCSAFSPYLTWRIAHVMVASLLPLAAHVLTSSLCGSRDVGVVAGVLVAVSVHLTVLGTHTLVHSLAGPCLFLCLAGLCRHVANLWEKEGGLSLYNDTSTSRSMTQKRVNNKAEVQSSYGDTSPSCHATQAHGINAAEVRSSCGDASSSGHTAQTLVDNDAKVHSSNGDTSFSDHTTQLVNNNVEIQSSCDDISYSGHTTQTHMNDKIEAQSSLAHTSCSTVRHTHRVQTLVNSKPDAKCSGISCSTHTTQKCVENKTYVPFPCDNESCSSVHCFETIQKIVENKPEAQSPCQHKLYSTVHYLHSALQQSHRTHEWAGEKRNVHSTCGDKSSSNRQNSHTDQKWVDEKEDSTFQCDHRSCSVKQHSKQTHNNGNENLLSKINDFLEKSSSISSSNGIVNSRSQSNQEEQYNAQRNSFHELAASLISFACKVCEKMCNIAVNKGLGLSSPVYQSEMLDENQNKTDFDPSAIKNAQMENPGFSFVDQTKPCTTSTDTSETLKFNSNCDTKIDRDHLNFKTSYLSIQFDLTSNIPVLVQAFCLSILCYVRPDTLLFLCAFVLPYFYSRSPAKLLRFQQCVQFVCLCIAGCLLALTVGIADDFSFYGFGVISPVNWFNFNVMSNATSDFFGTQSPMFYLEELFFGNFGMKCLFVINIVGMIISTVKMLKCVKESETWFELKLRLCVSLGLLLCIYSLQQHKELRFIHHVIVLYFVFTALNICSVSMIMSEMSSSIPCQPVTFLALLLFTASQWHSLPSGQRAQSLKTWVYSGSVDNYHVTRSLIYLASQNDVTGVFLDVNLSLMGGFTFLRHNVPLLALTFSGYHEFGMTSRVRTKRKLWSRGSTSLVSLARLSNYFHPANKPFLIRYLIGHNEYNFLVVASHTKFSLSGYTQVFNTGKIKVLKRLGTEVEELNLRKTIPFLNLNLASSSLLKKEAQQLFAFGLNELASERYEKALEFEQKAK